MSNIQELLAAERKRCAAAIDLPYTKTGHDFAEQIRELAPVDVAEPEAATPPTASPRTKK
jgi:hypothetical protein